MGKYKRIKIHQYFLSHFLPSKNMRPKNLKITLITIGDVRSKRTHLPMAINNVSPSGLGLSLEVSCC